MTCLVNILGIYGIKKKKHMKPNKQQLATLTEMEMWGKKIKKESERLRNKVDTMFRKELREGFSVPKDIKFSLRHDIDFALDELLYHIENAKDDLEL